MKETLFDLLEEHANHNMAATLCPSDVLWVVNEFKRLYKVNNINSLQQQAVNLGFKYWRSSDAHGIAGTKEQAESFIADLVGVEVEILLPNVQQSPGAKHSGA